MLSPWKQKLWKLTAKPWLTKALQWLKKALTWLKKALKTPLLKLMPLLTLLLNKLCDLRKFWKGVALRPLFFCPNGFHNRAMRVCRFLVAGAASAMLVALSACDREPRGAALSVEEERQLEEAAEMLDSRTPDAKVDAGVPVEIPPPFEAE